MSYWSTFIGIVQKFCDEDPEVEELLKQTDHLQKENSMLEQELEDSEREQTRLQIELYNVQAMLGPPNQFLDGRSVEETNMQLMQSCTNIRYAISQIDFVKILQCNHMQMEQDWRKEWQQMQEYSVAILKCHEQMEQRDVVQRYRKVEIAYKEAKINSEKQKKSLGKILKEGQLRLRGIKEKRNALIIAFVESCKDINSLKTEYQKLQEYDEKLERLNKRKSELMEQVQEAEEKNCTFLMPYRRNSKNDNKLSSSSSTLLQTFNNDMPKFPSFDEILRSFNQDLIRQEIKPEITVIQNTNITVKSILRNSQDNSMEINQSITTKHTKHVRFKLQLEEQFEFSNYTTDTTVSDSSSDDSQDTTIAMPQTNQMVIEEVEEKNLQEEIPTVDLITPTNSCEVETSSETVTEKDKKLNNKPKVDILECIVIKPALPNVAQNKEIPQGKENIPPEENFKVNNKSDHEIMPPPSTPAVLKKRDHFSKSFYEELLRSSPSPMDSSDSESGTSAASKRVLKDFNSFLDESNAASLKHSEPENTNEDNNLSDCLDFTSNVSKNSSNLANSLDFMDFDTNNFAFDSNDENEEGGDLDFLFS